MNDWKQQGFFFPRPKFSFYRTAPETRPQRRLYLTEGGVAIQGKGVSGLADLSKTAMGIYRYVYKIPANITSIPVPSRLTSLNPFRAAVPFRG